MEDYLKVITPHLHSDLVSASALSNLQALSQLLPCSFPYGLLECRLGVEQFQVDLQVGFPRLIPTLPSSFLRYPAWQVIQSLCQEWTDPSSFLYRSMNRVWLEFDVQDYSSEVPVPCIFLCMNEQVALDEFHLFHLVSRVLNQGISANLKSHLQLCLNSLPEGAKIQHLGFMLSRNPTTLRVNVAGIPIKQLSDYLQKIGWRDSTDTLDASIADLSQWVDAILLTIDVGETIYPRVGLECFLYQQPSQDPRWQKLCADLIDKGLCTEKKQTALLAWPGLSQKISEDDFWPANLTLCDRLLQGKAHSVFWRTINHIKIVYHPEQPLEAKAYLAFAHSWVDRSLIANSLQPQ
ncbi:hypothetical protein NIES4074_27230 [Cylindrospermum sp. NIES-4074]|nr:hypothetical protein NIES4074_27230 [Cylindrospermum sp. NIES-4074]